MQLPPFRNVLDFLQAEAVDHAPTKVIFESIFYPLSFDALFIVSPDGCRFRDVLKRVSIQKVRLFFLVNLHILVELSDIIVHLNLQEKLLLQFRQHIGLERVLGYMLVLKTINY
jgi:hypothetical protein